MTATSYETKTEPGKRYDVGKPRYDLIPPEVLDQLAMLYTVGADKYEERNWEKGMSWSRVFNPLMRHAWAFWRGETHDPETKMNHMIHVAWNALALAHYCGNDKYKKLDDRVLPPETKP
jgi:hypothetical protein